MHRLQTDIGHRPFPSRSSSASLSDDEDAITPIEQPVDHQHAQPVADRTNNVERRGSVQSVSSDGSMDIDNPEDTASIWRRMLALQRRYHCYNSARISAALECELVESVVPPRACLDLLNDSVADQPLPEEARREVEALLSPNSRAILGFNGGGDDTNDDGATATAMSSLELPPAARTAIVSLPSSTVSRSKMRSRRRKVLRRHRASNY